MQYGTSSFRDFPSFRNLFVNGDVFVNQKFTPNTNIPIALNTFLGGADSHATNFYLFSSNTINATVDISQSADHPLLNPNGTNANGYSNSVEVTAASAGAAGALDFSGTMLQVSERECTRFLNLNCILSFWVKSSKTGIHCVALCLSSTRTSYVTEYTINEANTWEYKTISVLMNPILGFPLEPQGMFSVSFPLKIGNGYITNAPNIWNNDGNRYYATINQQNLLDTVGNTFKVTDIQLESGFSATAYDRLPFNISLKQCEQYYCQTFPYGTIPVNNSGNYNCLTYRCANAGIIPSGFYYTYPTAMVTRAYYVPYNPGPGANGRWYNETLGIVSGNANPAITYNESGCYITNPQVITDAISNTFKIHAVGIAETTFQYV